VRGWRKKTQEQIDKEAAAEVARVEKEKKRKADQEAKREKKRQEAAEQRIKEKARLQTERIREAARAKKAEAAYARDMVRILEAAGYEVTKKKNQ